MPQLDKPISNPDGLSFSEKWEGLDDTLGKINQKKDEMVDKRLGLAQKGKWDQVHYIDSLITPKLDEDLVAVTKEMEETLRNRPVDEQKNVIPPEETPGLGVAETNTTGISWQEFISQKDTSSDPWLIDGLLRSGWLVVLGGHGKHGKSTLAVHLLNCLRTGEKFVNQCTKVPVIYLNCEMAAQDARELIEDVLSDSPADGAPAQIVNELKIPLDLQSLELFLTKQEEPGVCVIDSFRGAFLLSGDTENQAGTVGGILRHLQLIARKTKWSIVLIHHFRKSGTGEALDLAGSGEWLSAPDAIYTWSCSNFKEPGTLNVVGRLPPYDPLSIQLSRTHIEFLGTAKEHEAELEKARVLNSLSDVAVTSDDLARQIGLPPSTVRRRLEELVSVGKIERDGEGKKGTPFVWRAKTSNQKQCTICGNTNIWQRPDGDWVCSTCHPHPEPADQKHEEVEFS